MSTRQQGEESVERWVIQRDVAYTYCEDSHPVRLGRNPQHYQGESLTRRLAIDSGKRGYLCEGGGEHTYPVWVVYDAAHDTRSNAGTFDIYKEAVACRDRMQQIDSSGTRGSDEQG